MCALVFILDLFLYPVPDFCISTAFLRLVHPPPLLVVFSRFWIYGETLQSRVYLFVWVSVCVRGVHLGVSSAAIVFHPDGHDWLGEEGVEVLLAATWEKVLIYSVFGLKLVNIAIKNVKSVIWGVLSRAL